MQLISTLLLSGLFAGEGLAAALRPQAPRQVGTSHTVHLKRNIAYQPNGAVAYAKAHAKFGRDVPTHVAAAAQRARRDLQARNLWKRANNTGSATNTPTSLDTEYLTRVQIGTPPKTFNLDFDTGSSDLWLFSTNLPKTEVNGQVLYGPTNSSTATQIAGATWSITYGDGSSSSGKVFTDVVAVGGLTVSKQAVEPASKVSATFTSDMASDGLVGLAFGNINTVTPTQQKTFWESASTEVASNLFSVDLNHNAPGKYTFGAIDTSITTSPVTYTAVNNSKGFWTFSATGYGVGSNSTTASTITGIADTGTTLMLMPVAVLNAYYSKVTGAKNSATAGGVVFPCTATLPDFSFRIGSNMTVTVPGSYLKFSPVDATGTLCYGGMQSDASIGFSIFGDVALKAAYVVFDGGNTRLGFAHKALTNATTNATAANHTTKRTTRGSGTSLGRNGH